MHVQLDVGLAIIPIESAYTALCHEYGHFLYLAGIVNMSSDMLYHYALSSFADKKQGVVVQHDEFESP